MWQSLLGKKRGQALPFVLLVFFLWLPHSCVAQNNGGDDEFSLFKPILKFENFKVPVYKGKKAKLNLRSGHTACLYRTALKIGYKGTPVNFGGHYVLVTWGCGSPCGSGAIIDVKNGSVYDIPYAGLDYDYRNNSRMLIVNPPGRMPNDSNLYFTSSRPYEVPVIYVFNERTKKFVERKKAYFSQIVKEKIIWTK